MDNGWQNKARNLFLKQRKLLLLASSLFIISTFTAKGNLDYREDNLSNKESFAYDAMNRLTGWTLYRNNVQQFTNSLAYNSTTGLISSLSNLGNAAMNYGEDGQPPHALTSIAGTPSLIPSTAQSITYTDFKKVAQITEDDNVLDITYGVDEQRVKTVLSNPSDTLTRYYAGNYEEEVRNGSTRKIHYINGGNGLAALYVQNNGNDSLYFVHTDYQGSLLALSLPNGTISERYAYDPWGIRRDPLDWTLPDTRTSFIFHRGYTLHEHLQEFNLINMNGRVYDPLIAQFLSPDPFIQEAGDWLNYNRFGYAMNNPMIYTDPDGEFFYFFIMPYINFSPNGGLEFGLTGGIGIGGFNAFASVGYGKGNGFTATVGASYMGGYAYTGYNSQAGFIAGAGYGLGLGGIGNFSFNSSSSSLGVSYSSNGGFSTNIGEIQYNNKTGWTANPSFGISYNMTSGLYGTSKVVDDESYKYLSDENPIPYDRESAYKFMFANDLTDINNEWRNLYADGTLPSKNYSLVDKEGHDVLGATKGVGKKYIFWGAERSDIYLYPAAFRNPEKLYLTIGHELNHVWLNYRGFNDKNRQEATAYDWSARQAKAWNMLTLNTIYDVRSSTYSIYPYDYKQSIRINRPLYPF